jgi:hypothetical protein
MATVEFTAVIGTYRCAGLREIGGGYHGPARGAAPACFSETDTGHQR